MSELLIARIDAILPQTQCTQCGYPDCRGYAEALAAGSADIDQCPPGGEAGLAELAALLGRPIKPLNPQHGEHKPRVLAWIDEANCIGCTLCIQACPVDAIIGASKQMHTVIAAECTGCELCIPACPVDCIELLPAVEPALAAERQALVGLWRQRHAYRLFRLGREKHERSERLAAKALAKKAEAQFAAPEVQASLDAALQRLQARLAGEPVPPPAPLADAKAARIAEMMARAKRLREGG